MSVRAARCSTRRTGWPTPAPRPSSAPRRSPLATAVTSRPMHGWAGRRQLQIRSEPFAVVVIDRVLGAEHFADAALAALSGHDRDFLRIRVLTRLDIDECREREIPHRRLAGVDDLVGHVRAAGRARDHIVLADRIFFVAKAQLAFALDDQKHLLFTVMAVEGTLDLAGRQNREIVTKLLGSDVIADLAATRSVEAVFFDVVELDIVEV